MDRSEETSPAGDGLKAALDGPLAFLVDKCVLSPAYATREMDGRLVPVVFAFVVDPQRRPVAGVVLELHDADDQVVDTTRSSAGGLGVLRFPARKPRAERGADESQRITVVADGGEVEGTVHLLDGRRTLKTQSVMIPPDQQLAESLFMIDAPENAVNLSLGDDPLKRLPIDFSEDTCKALLNMLSNNLLDPKIAADPLGNLQAIPGGKREPLIRRLDVVRYGQNNNRYLVRLRQEWVLLTYTLGEFAEVQPLDPGAVVQSAEQLVNQVSSAVREAVDTAKSTLNQNLQDALSNLGSIDAVVHTVADASAHATGWGGGIPGIAGGGGVDAGAKLDLKVDTNVNTTLLVNRAIQEVSTLVNQAIAKAHDVAEGAQRTASDVANHLAPLVSHVANALHWRVYEVYAVCTNVEAVHPITVLPLFGPKLHLGSGPFPPSVTEFKPDEVLAYRPFFESALLDRTLVSAYDDLLQAAELQPLTAATVRVIYDATGGLFGIAARINMTLNGVTQTTTVLAGSGQSVTLHFNFPLPGVPRGGLIQSHLEIQGSSFLPTTQKILRVEIWIEQPLAGPGFVLDNPPTDFDVPIGPASAAGSALINHINHHLHYYYGVLVAAAIDVPSLRQDVPVLAQLDQRVWRLPLLGMEGTTALLLEPETNAVDVHTLLDDAGAGTLVEILAPGAYGEMLTGLLQIPTNDLHPLLKVAETISPFAPFPNLTTGGLPPLASPAPGTTIPGVPVLIPTSGLPSS
ncbi:hypothetical protein WL19_15705 [Burkholderia ubonensis]|nr:hypothetical protein WL19_15705 [Burkholderia ubonensis]